MQIMSRGAQIGAGDLLPCPLVVSRSFNLPTRTLVALRVCLCACSVAQNDANCHIWQPDHYTFQANMSYRSCRAELRSEPETCFLVPWLCLGASIYPPGPWWPCVCVLCACSNAQNDANCHSGNQITSLSRQI